MASFRDEPMASSMDDAMDRPINVGEGVSFGRGIELLNKAQHSKTPLKLILNLFLRVRHVLIAAKVYDSMSSIRLRILHQAQRSTF